MNSERTETEPLPVRLAQRVLGIEPQELVAVAWSFLYFFCIMSAYFMLRPVRDSMAVAGGVQNIPALFTGTFFFMMAATPVFGWVASRFPRKTFLPWVYLFFIANILTFYVVFELAQGDSTSLLWIGRAFFVWISVFNLFVVAVFWSFMADIYTKQQSRRLFGVISAGGSAGAIIGPAITSLLVVRIGYESLLPLSALLLALGVVCIYRLRRWVDSDGANSESTYSREAGKAVGGSAWAGFRFVAKDRYFSSIALALLCANFLGGVMYIWMAQLVGDSFTDTNQRTQVFAFMDTAINVLSFTFQLLVVKHSVRRLGIGWTLSLLPLMSLLGFALVAISPTFAVMAVFQVLRRSCTFGFTKPTSDMLYGVVSPEAKYKAKNAIDTTTYRAWDVVSSWTARAIGNAVGLSGIALVCLPIAIAWTLIARWIGREYQARDEKLAPGTTTA